MSQTSQLNARSSANQGAETYRPSVPDRVIAAGARALRFIPAPLLSVFSRTNNSGDRLDGDVALSLLTLKLVGGPDIADQDAVDARRNVDRQAYLAGSCGTKSPEVGLVDHRIVDGVRVRVYTPAGAARWQGGKPAPAIIYMHGGGWVTGSLDSHDSTCRFLCRRSSVQVYSIDYRMAPEQPFPASLEDATTVISAAVSGRIAEIDPEKVIIAGDSAGAHLATASTLWLRDRGLPQPALQMLFAPIVDLREVDEVMATYASRREYHDGPYITEDHFRWYDKAFVGELSDEERRGDLVSPILAEDLSGIAPAYVAVAGHDPLRDEGEAYAARLDEAGVPVTARRHRGLVHPFVNSSVMWSGSGRALDEAVGAVRHVLGI